MVILDAHTRISIYINIYNHFKRKQASKANKKKTNLKENSIKIVLSTNSNSVNAL